MTLAQRVGINIGDYGRNAEHRGWGTGWPYCGGVKDKLVTVVAPRSGARFPVHARAARMLTWWVERAEVVHGYRFKPSSCGAYNCRAIGGTRTPSNHSWGLAIDVNWNDNPFTSPLRTDIPRGMVDDAKYIGWAWGGDYRGKKDAMHFEFMGTPDQADRVTGELLIGPGLPTGRPVIKLGSKGAHVAEAQTMLRIEPDGIFGRGTEGRVKEFQRNHGLRDDGIVGPSTWSELDKVNQPQNGRKRRQKVLIAND